MAEHSFKVSVIIPVYNAEKYVTEAVESALMQPETGEVLLIEDKSPDNSLVVCQRLAAKYDKVKLFQHPDQGNHGAGATRNVGLLNAQFPYICFLDADDYMLPDRFKPAAKVFAENPEADGVYDAVGIHFENDEAKYKWFSTRSFTVTSINQNIPPKEVFYCQTIGKHGYFHTNGIIVKNKVFDIVGLFDTELKLAQDSFMFVKIAALCKLFPGSIEEPVAMRRVHDSNRILDSSAKVKKFKWILWHKLYQWSEETDIPKPYKFHILERFILINKQEGISLLMILIRKPQILINHLFYKYLVNRIKTILSSLF